MRRAAWVILLLFAASPLRAGLITTNPALPPDGDYVAPTGWQYPQSSGPVIRLQDVTLRALFSPPPVIVNIGSDEQVTYDAYLQAVEVGLGWGPIALNGPLQMLTFLKADQTVGDFAAEIVSIELQGVVSGVGTILLRESPSQSSEGRTAITDIGGGYYRIDSYFDVFTELSLDAGQTWLDGTDSTRMTLVPKQIPAPVTLILLLTGLSGLWLRQHRPIGWRAKVT